MQQIFEDLKDAVRIANIEKKPRQLLIFRILIFFADFYNFELVQ